VFRFTGVSDDVCNRYRLPRSSTTLLSSLRPLVSVGPHFACLQAKRCALLWSVSYPCSIFHTLVSRLCNVSTLFFRIKSARCPLVQVPEETLSSRPRGRFPSSSAPAFRMLVHSRGCLARYELPLQIHNFRSFSSRVCSLDRPLLASSGHWVILV